MINEIMKLLEWPLRSNRAWYVHTPDAEEGYYIDSLQDEDYLNDKLHYDAVAIKVDMWD